MQRICCPLNFFFLQPTMTRLIAGPWVLSIVGNPLSRGSKKCPTINHINIKLIQCEHAKRAGTVPPQLQTLDTPCGQSHSRFSVPDQVPRPDSVIKVQQPPKTSVILSLGLRWRIPSWR